MVACCDEERFGKIMIYIAFLFHLVCSMYQISGVFLRHYSFLDIEGKSCACASVLQNERE